MPINEISNRSCHEKSTDSEMFTKLISFCNRSLSDADRVFKECISLARKSRSCLFWRQTMRFRLTNLELPS